MGVESTMTPTEIVHELDRYVIGQDEAKRAVAIALRNRWRRQRVPMPLRKEICPKNILMIGSTGVGKTEIARRLASLANAPFIKVEATKFTEIGYVGRDVDSIIRDLADVAVRLCRDHAHQQVHAKVEELAEDQLIDALLKNNEKEITVTKETKEVKGKKKAKSPIEKKDKSAEADMRRKFRQGKLDDLWVDLELSAQPSIGVEIMAPPGMEEMTDQLQSMLQNLNTDKKQSRKLKVKDAFKQLCDQEAALLINEEEIRLHALQETEQNGIVFIDEIDKVVKSSHRVSGEVSREGVQRDLLPLLEGTTITTKYGLVKTDHILFIASGAFLGTKPSDMISELQGRLPIRVALKDLSEEDFSRILTEPQSSLSKQYIALLETEGVKLSFTQPGIKRLAYVAFRQNEHLDNIGARRLYTVLEKCLEALSFTATERDKERVKVDEAYVNNALKNLLEKDDLRRWIL